MLRWELMTGGAGTQPGSGADSDEIEREERRQGIAAATSVLQAGRDGTRRVIDRLDQPIRLRGSDGRAIEIGGAPA